MRVEAIVKKDGWFIPHPGIAVVKQKVSNDAFVQAAGMLKKATIGGVAFQKKLRKEWDGR